VWRDAADVFAPDAPRGHHDGEPRARMEAAAVANAIEAEADLIDLEANATKGKGGAAVASADYRSVKWFGTSYTFTKSQAACVKLLWEAWKADTPELNGLTVVADAKVDQCRLVDVFKSKGKMHPAWGTMIVPGGTKGTYRLNDDPAVVPKSRRKRSRKTPRKTPPKTSR